MMMSFLLHESPGGIELTGTGGGETANERKRRTSRQSDAAMVEEKFRLPEVVGHFERPRLLDLLDRSIDHYGATLLTGRAGTGKTTLAATFAARFENKAWLSIAPSDTDWREFSVSFAAALMGTVKARRSPHIKRIPYQSQAAEFLSRCFRTRLRSNGKGPLLIILDDIHHLFDAPWFADFFRQLIVSLDSRTRLVMLCRGNPSAPLWRWRSKQMLNVIDESVLNFTEKEAHELCGLFGMSETASNAAYRQSFGQARKLLNAIQAHTDQKS
jgi:LuxR family maltose regulon positive regulatory protein